jgi:hypothetical protein
MAQPHREGCANKLGWAAQHLSRRDASQAATKKRSSALRVMPQFHFKLCDTRIVVDHGSHDLENETAARIEAIKLARSIRETRPELLGRKCSVSVTTLNGDAICSIPIDHI